MPFFTIEKISRLLSEIQAAIVREHHPIQTFKFLEADNADASQPDFDDSSWADFTVGSYWGGYDKTAWFRTRLAIPEYLRDKKLSLRFLVGPQDGGGSTAETMLYVNGAALQAIDMWHEDAWLPPELVQNGIVTVALRAWSGVLEIPDRRRFMLAQLQWIDPDAQALFFITDTLIKALQVISENDLRHIHLLQILDTVYRHIDFVLPRSESFYQSVAAALQELRDQLAQLSLKELKPHVVGVGHAHIDMAWLWRLGHSRHKAGRTFATALHYMRQYPGYRFMHSSPQLYKFLKEDYPEIFNRVKERISSGQWEVTGGTWIEPDTNLTGGESLVRQFLLGKRYVRQEFGQEMNVLWLPDVFGYTASLPQIIIKSGLKYFMTTKISWSQFNRFPQDTFNWRGIDGTEVLTHFVTTPENDWWFYTYNGQFRPADVKGIWEAYRQKDINDELLMIYGWGDGGGGPTQSMIESAIAMQNVPGLPSVGFDTSEAYFARLGERLADRQLPVWDGELYLEYHRGTYTSQAANKRANRQSEILYHNAEWLSVLADVQTGETHYPANELNAGWEKILLNQFHDILPGSSIREVYEDSAHDYDVIRAIGEKAVREAQVRLLKHVRTEVECLIVFNSLSWVRNGLIDLPWQDKTIVTSDGVPASSQEIDVNGERRLLLAVQSVPPLGYEAHPLIEAPADQPSSIHISAPELENSYYRIALNEKGQITSLFDKRCNREVLAAGACGNVLQAFQDIPVRFDAWDIDIYYQEKMREVDELLDAVVEETGPVRGTLRLRWQFGGSTITQRLSLYHDSPRLDFRTEIDWFEQHVLLKVAFPVSVRSTRATYEIQFGSVERPTHWNTSWDWARFEVPGHKWADLSEGDYGVALLNDCKYGHDIKGNVMRLTLIKSATSPDAMADQGHHVFTYSLLPHVGDWRDGNVAREAYALNYPLLAAPIPSQPQGRLPAQYQFVAVDADNVVIETVKKAEDDEAWIVRVYEYQQSRRPAVTLTFGHPIRRAVECNLVEEGEESVRFEGKRLVFAIMPFEIKTFKIWLS